MAMTTKFLASRSRSTWDEPKTARTEEDQAHQWLELTEQRQRCV
jgi:hypothetical protein